MTTLAVPFGFRVPSAADGSVLLGLPETRAARRLDGATEELVKLIATHRRDLLLPVLEKRREPEFSEAAEEAFTKYLPLVIHHGRLVSTWVPREALERLAQESLCELEGDIRLEAANAFGSDLQDRAMFAAWTLRKIATLVDELGRLEDKAPLSGEARDKDEQFFTKFLLHALRARFSLDLLMEALRSKRTLYPDAQPWVADSLRSIVDAYAWVTQAVDLRAPQQLEFTVDAPWDDEDEGLLAESMEDLRTAAQRVDPAESDW